MTDFSEIRFAPDMCTFYDPAFWGHDGGYADIGNLFSWGTWTERTFWERVLNAVKEAGLDGFEMTFAPGDWTAELKAYGSAEAFSAAERCLDRSSSRAAFIVDSREPSASSGSSSARS